MRAVKFSCSASASKEALPIGAWTIPNLSARNSMRPPLTSLTARATSKVTVPDFGFGIRPRGPRIRPSGPTLLIMSGVATATSKSVNPSETRLTRSSPPTMSAPASLASRSFSPAAKTATRTVFPVPRGRVTELRSCWSAWRTSMPRRMWASTVASNLVIEVSLATATACIGSSPASPLEPTASRTRLRASSYFLPCFLGNFDPHRARRPLDHLHRRVEVERVEVLHLELGDLRHLVAAHLAHLLLVGRRRALLDPGRLLQEVDGGWGLQDEGEGPVLVDGDLGRDHVTGLRGRLLVVGLDEVHDVDPVGAERGAHRGSRGGLAGLQLDLEDRPYLLLAHFPSLPDLRFSGPSR